MINIEKVTIAGVDCAIRGMRIFVEAIDDFSCEKLGSFEDFEKEKINAPVIDLSSGGEVFGLCSPKGLLIAIIDMLNECRELYLKTEDEHYWWQMIQLLPSSYNQKRTIMLNYEVLTNIYKYRKNHRLDEWVDFCKWIETLPLSEIITGGEKNEQ